MFGATKIAALREWAAVQAGQPLPADLTEADLIDLIRSLEDLKSAASALQARASVDFAARRQQAEEPARVPAAQRGRGVSAELALARRESPNRGGRLLGLAQALTRELPHTFAALQTGAISEWRATLIARETAVLDPLARREAEQLLFAEGIEGYGDLRLVNQLRRLAYRLDPHGYTDRARKAAANRNVTIRPAPDTMTRLSALLPVADGVACYAALKQAADAARASGDPRSRGQVMADTLFERLTGRSTADGSDVEVKLVLTDRTLFASATGGAGDCEPGHLEGYGTVPADWARDLVRRAATHGVGLWFRQLYTQPVGGALIAMSSRRRCAPAGLADFVATRDQTCRTPYCDAPIRNTDHVWESASGGPTTSANSQGLCEACNHAKQAPGWRSRNVPGPRHTVYTTTPTGHRYRSTAPPLPGHEHSFGELYSGPAVGLQFVT